MIYFSAVGMVNALGNSNVQIAASLKSGIAPGMSLQKGWLTEERPVWLGAVTGELPAISDSLLAHRSRNNQLLLAALAQIEPQVHKAISRYGKDRVAVIMGTSTSGIAEGEDAVRHLHQHGQFPPGYDYQQQELGDPSEFMAELLDLCGPAYTLSTACSSSARAIISGKRLIDAGLADAALVGGADSLCRMPVNGFNSLESFSRGRCTPFGQHRDGINIGEASALILLTREPADVALLGTGESSDAWHMSAPHPQGLGAERAICMALEQAGLSAADVGYINAHGTATPLNDQAEAAVIHRLFGNQTPCSSTKHLTGHTLGAAGATEAALSWLILTQNLNLPPQDFSVIPRDTHLPDIRLVKKNETLAKPVILSNSFAFGGNNACIVIGRPS
ncbi:FabV family 3-oxoacyl-[ACP] synthase [Rahnella aquatilis CIP 78.65 = ATCC 33071]|uniref:3-oxoacyl-(Acyl-carrier-protein) synthase n=1 Tax=Rahnella aquatilis (strain ATCC 33071 / DSM 4594 / JCM 1683 / NBRC 105701 / NCIMB 13365 / CIP 78.65) TaxID=745277 RepID=H2IXR8_RAHAC|nr:beta-ketoacyl-[acyl-carrier-protein] synthase family protein [Rahnella aquatilis]AEX50871.1 3-oxoacyl-(acyl-carrier-protein) synthase [Rahnella aquatilis CIP 78.65 = ATCC 33071]KFD18689.1 FabV family 3-oxoacyl-[ACP] synthase [Rahnella aquatilis CIP 78.65 = ATCC 33071]